MTTQTERDRMEFEEAFPARKGVYWDDVDKCYVCERDYLTVDAEQQTDRFLVWQSARAKQAFYGCDSHIPTSTPHCPVCLINERDRLREEVNRLLAKVKS